jgi:pimeloyl-ACP methyl ester carboxylesterase
VTSGGKPPVYRYIRSAGKIILMLVAVLLLGAVAYEHLAAWRDQRVLSQVGRSVDVGGRTLNIHCIGAGTPIVIFESGRTAPGYVWTPAQRAVSEFTRACWYDRAGLGWSDPGPDPSWGDAAAHDLHRLTTNAGLHPPFVLVGASFGGYIIRLYNHAYPGEIAGIVFADAAHEDAGTIAGMPHRERPHLPRSVIRGLSIVFGRFGMMRMVARDPGPNPQHWSPQEWDVLRRLRRQRTVLVADAQTGPERATADVVRSAGTLGDVPLIVLTQGKAPADSSALAVQQGWIGLQHRLAQLSSRGRQIIVKESGHGIPMEAPDAIVVAVRQIVTSIRSTRY